MANEKIYTEADVADAIDFAVQTFIEELKLVMDPLSLMELVVKVCRNMEAKAGLG